MYVCIKPKLFKLPHFSTSALFKIKIKNPKKKKTINTSVLIVLLCTLICALVLNSAIRCFLRGGGGGNNHQQPLP